MRLAVPLLMALALASPGPAFATPTQPSCTVDDEAAVAPGTLPNVSKALGPGLTLNVLAIGSANLFRPEESLAPGSLLRQSVQNAPASTVPPSQVINAAPSGTAFPQRMADALQASVPGSTVKVTVRGGRGLSAADQFKLLTETLDQSKFELVLWQTGTVEAVRNLPPSDFAQTLSDGIEKATKSGADVVLIDPQFSRFLQTNSNIEPYEQAFQVVGALPNVLLFRRFETMRNWANDGQIDLERTPKTGRVQAVQKLHECLGNELARLVAAGARS